MGITVPSRKQRRNNNSSSSPSKSYKQQIKALTKSAQQSKRQIAALKRKVDPSSDSDLDDDSSAELANNAGDSFGSRSKKARSKKPSLKKKRGKEE